MQPKTRTSITKTPPEHPKKSTIFELLTGKLTKNDANTTINYIQNLENQLIHSQRLASLGQSTSEIIHEFNNLLGGILGYTTLLKTQLNQKSDAFQYTSTIEQTSLRGTQLTNQLLNTSRKESYKNTTFNINEIIQDIQKILTKTIRKNIQIKINTTNQLPNIRGLKTQIHQVIMNLCINASDAIQTNGQITITTKITNHKQEKSIKITITDTGSGIEPKVQKHIFEPFFTTKKEGKGTGLGLSITKTIINNHNGSITFKTEPNKGTTFTIKLPIKTKQQQNLKTRSKNTNRKLED